MITVQVLVATMKQDDHSLLDKMNIQTDALIGNQCDKSFIENFSWNGKNITYFNFEERGVGLNRNNTLMRADADVCLFADDDMVYVDGYDKIVDKAFEECKDADVIIFNLHEENSSRYIIKNKHRVRYYNYLRYGTARVAVRTNSVKKNAIYFNQCFGGGTSYCHGEDNLFLTECLKKGLKIYAVPYYIAKLTDERLSTWNNGYDQKYINDQGVLYRAISKHWWRILCLQDALRKHNSYGMNWWNAFRIMIEGGKSF
ncbi:MAG: glycosyltransferase family 2 protein [Lachnospiraceae bacterium]|nr:glycosyltransferase family 2 protein [Lachnospiraceae bacterium]MBP3595258.1 glycosyltransferase family 2 protein [Lachnospiraceae bacterium]